ncbi:MAG: hypothetical protein K6A92_03955 [Lachnospiraceae bacterium]|nr:hypothetical protein [Lachnospiraceae bacterium]
MDSFIDRLSQRLSGQDAIKANNAAEAQETQRLRGQVEDLSNQVAGFDACLQEIRTVNVKSAANVDKAEELLSQGIRKLETLLEEQKQEKKDAAGSEELDAVKAELSELKKLVTELSVQLHSTSELVENQNKAAADQVSRSEDFTHRENLKVYRNVQAVVVEELNKQTETLKDTIDEATDKGGNGGVLAVGIITMLLALASVAFQVLQYLGIL